MACFVMIPGAGGDAWYWHRVVPLLRAAGHQAIAVDLPGSDDAAGLDVYAELVSRVIPEAQSVILVALSMGGFTAPLVCARRHVDMLVFVNAMLPEPGETAGAWWGNTGATPARERAAKQHGYNPDFDLNTYFLHDVPDDVAKQSAAHQGEEAQAAFTTPCAFEAWPSIPTHVLSGQHDRFFPLEFQERVARERLRCKVETLAGGHLITLSNPRGLADRLLAYAQELASTSAGSSSS